MLIFTRFTRLLTVCVLALVALAALAPEPAVAQIPASQVAPAGIQVDGAGQQAPDGVLPDGMQWNKPLKAGDMVLPRLTKPQPKTTAKNPASPVKIVPKGDLKAPQMDAGGTPASEPQTKDGSTASMMLLQGMKSALQKAGQNPDLPKSELVASDPMQTGEPSGKLTPPKLGAGKGLDAAAPNAAAVPLNAKDGEAFVAGQEPKGWVSPESADTISFPPEMTPAGDQPKATELEEQPVALENASTKKPQDKGFFERITSPFSSIFGDPVKEDADEKKIQAPKNVAPLAAKGCEPSVEAWAKECADAGYPAHYVGQITGETRNDCTSGDKKDVWLTNTCAAPIGSSAAVVQGTAASIAPSVVMPEKERSSDGACGVANGLASNGKPADDLCSHGDATPVLGDGPWHWSCKGAYGGMTVSCAAPVASVSAMKKDAGKNGTISAASETVIEDGKCGVAANVGTETAPTTGLCDKGTSSRVNGDGPWTWACSGLNGGSAAACTANRKTDGVCGLANATGTDTMPMRDLCTAGYASAVTGNGPWNWSCSGLYGGAAATCSATPRVNAVCGPASLKGFTSAPSEGLCNVGSATAVTGDGPWNWRCQGESGGASVSCQASILADGQCGPAHGNRFESAPKEGLCEQGLATRVTGLGPWNWNCSGSNGGATATCTAALGSKEEVASVVMCGKAAESLAFDKPTDGLCATGTASTVSGNGPWTWSCSDKAGHNVACSTLAASEGVCGKAANVSVKTAPENDLCEKGAPSEVSAFEKKSWRWTCQGSMGADSAVCMAPMATGGDTVIAAQTPAAPAEAVCGSAAGQSSSDKPSANLCDAGKAGTVKGNGPWTWTCATKTKKVTCEAQKFVDGLCGSANGSSQKFAPVSGLCATGSPTEISGAGPWLWSCIGSGGGTSSSCSAASVAQTKVDGVCGAAANAVMTDSPAANLCDSGMPSTVYGDGPWTWTCSGMNGGIASTCSTSKVVPKAPPPPGPAVNGVCGSSNGVAALAEPESGLCSSGTTSALSGNGPWNWSCIGANGGMTVSCTAPLMPPAPIVGECGGASGVPTLTTPKSGLCSAGIASAVSGKGPWTWSCSGTNGGGAVSCVAPVAGSGTSNQPLPSLVTPSADTSSRGGDAPSPRAAPVGLVTPQLPTGTLPALKPGTVPQLKGSKKKGEDESSLKSLKAEPLTAEELAAPIKAPELPKEVQPLNPPPIRDTVAPPAGMKPPVVDSTGKPIPGAKIALDPEVAMISFARGSDQLDKDSVEQVEKLAKILLANPSARISLIAYSDTGGDLTPRDAKRLSLNRALAIRDFMATKGVPSNRVDVRPMGANVPSGDMDRVDVKVN